MPKNGRPLKLNELITVTSRNEETQEVKTRELTIGQRLIEFVRGGSYKEDAALAVGISRASFFGYLARGRLDREAGKSSDFSDFLDGIEKAQAEANIRLIAKIERGAQGWQGSAWVLERTQPEKFGQRTRLMIESAAKQEANELAGEVIARVLEEEIPDPEKRRRALTRAIGYLVSKELTDKTPGGAAAA
jgi:hypothetical protein